MKILSNWLEGLKLRLTIITALCVIFAQAHSAVAQTTSCSVPCHISAEKIEAMVQNPDMVAFRNYCKSLGGNPTIYPGGYVYCTKWIHLEITENASGPNLYEAQKEARLACYREGCNRNCSPRPYMMASASPGDPICN